MGAVEHDPYRGWEPAQQAADEYPVTERTTVDVLDWVGDDPVKAAAALAQEEQSSRPRKTLLAQLRERSAALTGTVVPPGDE